MGNQSNRGGQSELESKDRLSEHMPSQQQSNAASTEKQSLVDKAQDIAAAAGEKVDQVTAGAGKGLGTIAEGIRKYSPAGESGATLNKLADTVETGGQFLQDHHMADFSDELGRLIRNNPMPAVLVALGVGFMLARATSRS